MPAILYPGRWSRRPTLGSQINWGHPLAPGLVGLWLFNEAGGPAVSLVNPADVLMLTGSATWSQGTDGPALYTPNIGALTGAILATPSAAIKPTNAVSILWRGSILGNGGRNNNPTLFGMFHNNSNSPPYESYALTRQSSGPVGLYFQYNASGSAANVDVPSGIVTANYGKPVSYGATRISGRTRVYRDGELIGSDSASGSIAYDPTAALVVNRHITSGADNSDTTTEYAAIWNRELSAQEYIELTDPYCIIISARSRRYFFGTAPATPGAGAITAPVVSISGSGSIGITGSGTFTAPHPSLFGFDTVPNTGGIEFSSAILGYGYSVVPDTGSSESADPMIYGTGTVTIPGPDMLLCFVGGKHSRLLVNTSSIEQRMNTRSTGSCSLFSPPDVSPVRPRPGQEIKIIDSKAGRIEFCGQIDKVKTSQYPGKIVLPAYMFVCAFSDLSAVLDRRPVVKAYPVGSSANSIALDIVATFLNGENITTNNVRSMATTTAELKFTGNAMDALKRLCDMTGDMFCIDVDNDLNMFAPGQGGPAPFVLTDDTDTIRDLELTDTLIGFSNNAFIRSNQNLGITDSLA